jgi:hypothetical protein
MHGKHKQLYMIAPDELLHHGCRAARCCILACTLCSRSLQQVKAPGFLQQRSAHSARAQVCADLRRGVCELAIPSCRRDLCLSLGTKVLAQCSECRILTGFC